jgi:hypothetical protein
MKSQSSKTTEYTAMLVIWLGLVLLFGMLSHNFLSARTFAALANRIPALVVVAAGMTLVLIIGGIDLSAGSVVGLCGSVLGVAMTDYHLSFWAGTMICLGIGLAAGALNGAISVCLGIPSFIVTLGMLEVARGLAYLTTHSQTKYIGGEVEGLSGPIHGLGVSPAFFISILVIAQRTQRGQPQPNFHHEGHEDHEEKSYNLSYSILRVLRALRGEKVLSEMSEFGILHCKDSWLRTNAVRTSRDRPKSSMAESRIWARA